MPKHGSRHGVRERQREERVIGDPESGEKDITMSVQK
jgi:hypothetical protein